MLHPFPTGHFAPSPTAVDIHASNDCFPFPRWLVIKKEVALAFIAVELVMASLCYRSMRHVFAIGWF
jgi:hypothetical protein